LPNLNVTDSAKTLVSWGGKTRFWWPNFNAKFLPKIIKSDDCSINS